MRKTSGVADVIANALAPLAAGIEVAFIFGRLRAGRSARIATST